MDGNDARIRDLGHRLRCEVEGDVLFDRFSRGRYSTDASIYQIFPVGVVVPRNREDARIALQMTIDAGIAVLPRGGGTSQCGQTVGEALVIDNSKYLNRVVELDVARRRVRVEPGIVLDDLNRALKPHGLFYPVDVSTSSRATIGGMTGNNSCGSRSIRYGNMVHNVRAVDAVLSDGERIRFTDTSEGYGSTRYRTLVQGLRTLHRQQGEEIAARFPKLLRRVGGYNIDSISASDFNAAHLLVGSEGTLAYFEEIELDLQPVPTHKVLGVCHFPRFYDAMDCTQHIVKLDPAAVELVDRTMIDLAREIPAFRATVDQFLVGEPDALLLVEFAGDERETQLSRLRDLSVLLADLGFPEAVVAITDPAQQSATWEVRKAGLNIMMSMKGDGKPVSFIEDCAVPLEDLAEYTDRLTTVFEKHGTRGTWYAHASVGCLHVRPILNMKQDEGARKMRAIAEEAFAMVREYKGSHSGEHGDGLVRSEWHEPMFGSRIVRAFESVKREFDPSGLMNPGKIVNPSKMDDRSLFRFPPDYRVEPLRTSFDWSAWGGFGGAVEMCNNNGACRKSKAGVMCPSFRVTGDEQHLTRGRANSLRLAISGQLGPNALTSDDMYATMDLCVGCKGCKRECPTGVDMARMKTEFLHQYHLRHRRRLKDRVIAALPRYAPIASRLAPLLNSGARMAKLRKFAEGRLGLSARRTLPAWQRTGFVNGTRHYPGVKGDVVLLVDTFNNWFEPENAYAALTVLRAAGYSVHIAVSSRGRPLCCGRTYLAAGMVEQARAEAERTLLALQPFVVRGVPIVGLEPSCLLTLRDEFGALLPGERSTALARCAMLLEEFLVQESDNGRLDLPLAANRGTQILVHGHCHQKAFGTMDALQRVLQMVPEWNWNVIESGCCGMAGAFGYESAHYELSMKMAEADLLPSIRASDPDTILVANGTSCRHQIRDGSGRPAIHLARLLQSALRG